MSDLPSANRPHPESNRCCYHLLRICSAIGIDLPFRRDRTLFWLLPIVKINNDWVIDLWCGVMMLIILCVSQPDMCGERRAKA